MGQFFLHIDIFSYFRIIEKLIFKFNTMLKKIKGAVIMAKSMWMTPEESLRNKKIKKYMLYINITIGTILLSALVTILANKIS